jgi:hypothetical protein
MENNMIVFLIAGILVGAGVGIGVGYVMFDGDDAAGEETYWFYIDYGAEADATHVNGWVSNNATDFKSALKNIFGSDLALNETEVFINSIKGIENDVWSNTLGGSSWMTWFWKSSSFEVVDLWNAWVSGPGLNTTLGNVMYLGFGFVDPVSFASTIDPNTTVAWKIGGPFPAVAV